jgi:hypothetical protein
MKHMFATLSLLRWHQWRKAALDIALWLSTSEDVRDFFNHGLYPVTQLWLGAGVPLTSPQLYGFSHTDDLRQAILYIAQLYPHAPLLGLGFSLGANILTRYVAEEGESCRLVSACTLACVCIRSLVLTFHVRC